ncbi:hypothetical protein Tco_0767496 [Tanacetum coccineum]
MEACTFCQMGKMLLGKMISEEQKKEPEVIVSSQKKARLVAHSHSGKRRALTNDENPHFPKHVYKVVKLVWSSSSTKGLVYELTSFLDLQEAVCDEYKVFDGSRIKKIFKYLKGQPKLGLWYPRDSPFVLEAYSDSDYAGSHGDRKSTTDGCQFMGRRLISWQCKKQTIVATSLTEAEYVASANCCSQDSFTLSLKHSNGVNFNWVKMEVLKTSPIVDIMLATMLPLSSAIADEGTGEAAPDELILAPFHFPQIVEEDETLRGSFHTTPPRSTQVPPVGPTSGGAEDLATLTALSSLVLELVQKVSTLESELKAHKLKVVMSELIKKRREQDGGSSHQSWLAAAALDVMLMFLTGAEISPSPHAYGMSAGVFWCFYGTLMVHPTREKISIMEVDPSYQRRTFRQMEEDWLAKYLLMLTGMISWVQVHAISRRRALWLHKWFQENRIKLDLCPTKGLHKNLCEIIFERLGKVCCKIYNPKHQEDSLKCGEDLVTRRFQRKPKHWKLHMSSQPDVPQQQATNVPPVDPQQPSESSSQLNVSMLSGPEKKGHTYGTRRKSLGTRKKSSTVLDLDADDRSFIRSSKYFTHLREILHLVDKLDLLKLYGMVVKYYEDHPLLVLELEIFHFPCFSIGNHSCRCVLCMFADGSYPLFSSGCYYGRAAEVPSQIPYTTIKLEDWKLMVGNDMDFIVWKVAAFGVHAVNFLMLLQRLSPAIIRFLIQEVWSWFQDVAVQSSRIVTTSRYVVPTGRVKVPAGRYVVPTGKDNVIVSAGRSTIFQLLERDKLGSSEGSSIIPEVLDESKDNSITEKQARNVQTSLTLSSAKLEIHSMVDVSIHQEDPAV